MKTLMIQVLGVGLIPRGKGIAPKKEPFPATRKEIELIMEHGTLQPRMRNPKTGTYVTITARNFDRLWNTFAVDRDAASKIVKPAVTEAPKKEEPKQENKPQQPTQVQFTKQNNNKPKWEQKQEQRQQENKSNDNKPAEEAKKEEDKKTDETFTVTTSSDKK